MAAVDIDRQLFAACLIEFRASGWWSEDEISEYKELVGLIMKGNDEEAKQAARDFWASRVHGRAIGINQRIRADIARVAAEKERLAA